MTLPSHLAERYESPSVAIVGAGLSGLMAGRTLRDHGFRVTLFDKGRRPGGRANTREHGIHRFDHGAQYFTARYSTVQRTVRSWIEQRVVAEWSGTLVRIEGDERTHAKEATRYVGVPGMIDVAKHLAVELDVHAGVRVEEIRRDGTLWSVQDVSGSSLGRFDRIVIAVPAAQAVPLLSAVPQLQEVAAGIDMAPCWAGMFAFERSLALDFDGAFLADGPFSWFARDSSKPGRPAGERWVLHAGPEWTREHVHEERGRVADHMVAHLAERFGPLPEVTFRRAHRWGYALATDPVSRGALYDGELGLAACGDWCWGGRIEGALLSGIAAAERILGLTPTALAHPQ